MPQVILGPVDRSLCRAARSCFSRFTGQTATQECRPYDQVVLMVGMQGGEHSFILPAGYASQNLGLKLRLANDREHFGRVAALAGDCLSEPEKNWPSAL